jgi:hypothetical protein
MKATQRLKPREALVQDEYGGEGCENVEFLVLYIGKDSSGEKNDGEDERKTRMWSGTILITNPVTSGSTIPGRLLSERVSCAVVEM